MKLKLGVSLLMISINFISSHGMLCSTLMSMFFDSWEMSTLTLSFEFQINIFFCIGGEWLSDWNV